MVIDSSALIAVMTGEPERRAFIEAIAGADTRLLGAPSMLETRMVLPSRAGEGRPQGPARLLRAARSRRFRLQPSMSIARSTPSGASARGGIRPG